MNEAAQPQQPKKKGLGPVAWIAIGCAGLILLGIVAVGVGGFFVAKKGAELVEEIQDNPAKSMAEMAIKMNPETEFISSDDESVTFETKDGEVVTMNFEDIQQGRFSMTTEEGETSTVTFGPAGLEGTTRDSEGQETDFNIFGGGGDTSNVPDAVKYPGADGVTPMIASRSASKWSGMLSYKTDSSLDEVVEWQESALEGCDLTRTDVAGMRSAVFSCGSDSVTLTFMGQDGSLTVTVNYDLTVESE